MISIIVVKSYEKPEYNIREILRYMGCKEADETVTALIDECLEEIGDRLSFKICCREFEIFEKDFGLDLGFMETSSRSLKKNLDGCGKIMLFAATVGLEIDRLIARYGRVSPVKSVAFQAIGAERIESLCDLFENEVREYAEKNGCYIRPRFSAGYGDFGIESQEEIFKALDCRRKIGITLNDSMLMSPSKSVTAIIGISDKPNNCKSGCSVCGKTDCKYRKI